MIHKIYLTNLRYGKRGVIYDAEYEGEVIATGTRMPFLDGCRALQERGLSGEAELWDRVRSFPRMRGSIKGAAKLTVEERSGAPVFRKWHPYERGEVTGGDLEDGG